MEITAALARQLRGLSEDPAAGDRLVAGLGGLGRNVSEAVPSCVAVSLLLGRFGAEFTVSVLADRVGPSTVLASLALPLSGPGWADTLILRAEEAGAFVLLADDLGAGLDGGRPPMQLDRHLAMPPALTGESMAASLADFSVVNQGIGILIARGLPPEAARRELERRASGAGVSLAVAGRRLIAAPRPRADPGPP